MMRSYGLRSARAVSSLSRSILPCVRSSNNTNSGSASSSQGQTTTSHGYDRSFQREIEEIVLAKMLSANPHQQPASLTTVSTSRQAVVPAPARPTLEEPIHLPSLDRGVFESRFEPDDPYKRSAFDRIIAARITNDLSLYGVIDGHGTSSLCAEYLAESLPMVVKLLLEGKTTKAGDEAALSNNYFTQVLREAFRICSKEWDGSSQIRSNAHYRHSGAVAFVALINHKNNFMFTANAGDCRCLVSQASGRGWRFLNPAHRTDNVHERMRILHQGGRIRSVNGVPRVQGALIPTRVFGDVELKIDFFGRMKPFLDPEPDLATFELVPSSSSHPHSNGSTRNHHQESVHKEGKNVAKSHWAVLASDGLWDSLETEAIVDMCREAVANGKQAEDLAKSLGKTAMQLTDDDVSVMVLMW